MVNGHFTNRFEINIGNIKMDKQQFNNVIPIQETKYYIVHAS